MPRLILQANNIHYGGGKTLLLELIRNLRGDHDIILILDERLSLGSLDPGFDTLRVKPNLVDRLKAEIWLKKNVRPDDTVLCFGNLPPLFRLQGLTKLFLQNRYLVDNVSLQGFGLRSQLKIRIERLWLGLGSKNIDEFIVQTASMKHLLDRKIPEQLIRIIPFCNRPMASKQSSAGEAADKNGPLSFVYVASGEPHKNHATLFDAWHLLAAEGLTPTLHTTLSAEEFSSLKSKCAERGHRQYAQIINSGYLDGEQLQGLYSECSAHIYPSFVESFGLPLIEAEMADLPVIACELDYVRDLLDPAETFDPHSAVSIARAVKRFMGQTPSHQLIIPPDQFLKKIMSAPKE